MLEFYNHKIVKARKNHLCELCGKRIEAGEKYSYECGKYEGDFFVRKMDLTCFNILERFCAENRDEDFDLFEITDYLREKYCTKCDKHEDCSELPERCSLVREKFNKYNED